MTGGFHRATGFIGSWDAARPLKSFSLMTSSFDREVAVKLLAPELGADPSVPGTLRARSVLGARLGRRLHAAWSPARNVSPDRPTGRSREPPSDAEIKRGLRERAVPDPRAAEILLPSPLKRVRRGLATSRQRALARLPRRERRTCLPVRGVR